MKNNNYYYDQNYDDNANFDGPSTHMDMSMPVWDEDQGYIYPNAVGAQNIQNPLTSPANIINEFANGGAVKNKKSKVSYQENPNMFPLLAELIRAQGEGEDVILAHINKEEAKALSLLSPTGGTINPITGLPQFGLGNFFKNPLGTIAKAVTGKTPRGGVFGKKPWKAVGSSVGSLFGAAGGALQNAARGKSVIKGAVKGAAITAAALGAAHLGSAAFGANAAGAGGAGAGAGAGGAGAGAGAGGAGAGGAGAAGASPLVTLGPGGANASVGPSFGAGSFLGGSPAVSASAPALGSASTLGSTAAAGSGGFLSSLISDPRNLLALASVAGSALSRPKAQKLPEMPRQKTPEEIASEEKRYALASMMTPAEMATWEANELEKSKAKRRIKRNSFLPEERLGDIAPLYTRTNSPEEYRKTGRWLSHYDNPEFSGNPKAYKNGGSVLEEEINYYPPGMSFFLEGNNGGQDDDRRMDLLDGSYIIDATTTAHLGDGNNKAGAAKIKALVSDGETYISPEGVRRVGKGDHAKGTKLLDMLVKNVRKHKGGSSKLPPKALTLTKYMRG